MNIEKYILETFIKHQNDAIGDAIADHYGLGEADKDTASWETVATYVPVNGDVEKGEYCEVEVQVGQGDSGLWYIRTEDDSGGSDEMDSTAYLTRDEAAKAAKAFAKENDESESVEKAEQEKEKRQARIDELTSEDGAWQIVNAYGVVASAHTEEAAEELLSLLREQDDTGEMDGCYVTNLSADAKREMADLEAEGGDWGVLDMDGNVLVRCASEADAEAWVEAEATVRQLSLRGKQGYDNCYWPRSVVQLSKGYRRTHQYSTEWTN
jgi:hypothetical protein